MKTEKIICEVCKSADLTTVLDLGMHPLCDDLLEINATETCEEFQIEITLCNQCLTAHQLHPVPKRKLFPSSYHYRSSMTQDVLRGMEGLVGRAKDKYGSLMGKKVVDIGCNDGSLLKFFRSEGAQVFGVEPTAAANEAEQAGIRVINDFFDVDIATAIVDEIGHPDFITFTNVFAHIEDIDSLFKAVQTLMDNNTRLIIENHYLGAVLNRFQFDTFYHEHPRTYSTHSFVEIAKRLNKNIEVVEFPARYGGNIRIFIGPALPEALYAASLQRALDQEKSFQLKFKRMRSAILAWKARRDMLLSKVRSNDGKIYGKAFPGRAAILIKLLDLSEKDIAAVFEKPNSMKIGNYIPGTRIPILSESALHSMAPAPRVILNLAWHISTEIHAYMKTIDPLYECVDIFSPDEYIE
jgi:hypothetical protein